MDIKATLNDWQQRVDGVTLKDQRIDGQQYYEFAWQRPDGARAFIDVYPQQDDLVLVQHAVASGYDAPRQQGGFNRWRTGELTQKLTQLKQMIERAQQHNHMARPKLGSVGNLKLR